MNRGIKLRKPRAPVMTVTGTAELVLVPQIRRFRARLYVGAAASVLLLVFAAIAAVRYLSDVEPMLAAEGANAARAVVYELPVGSELHVPIEPHTDLLRFIVHAYGKSDMALTPHPARLAVDVRGELHPRKEEMEADVPGLRSRVAPENNAIGVGDPLPFEVDVHESGVGELVIKLTEITGADGVLIRAYRREQLNPAEVGLREAALDRAKKDELAKWTWELGWDELTPPEHTALLQARWRRIGALRGTSTDLRSTAIAVSPAPIRESPPLREELLGRVPLRGDERVAMIVHPNVKVRFLSDEATALTATWRDAQNVVDTKTATGQIDVGPFDSPRSVELKAARDVLVEVRSVNAAETEWLGWSDVFRISPTRPVIIDSPDGNRVVRVSLRKPMGRAETATAHFGAAVELSGVGATRTERWTADRPRSRVDRYEDFDSPEAPSERVAFFLSLPRGAHAKVTPLEGVLVDVSLAELDTAVPPLAMPARVPDSPPPILIAEVEDAKSAWVPRRPSNAAAFDETSKKVVRSAHWFAPAPPPPPPNTVALAHAKHIDVDRTQRGEKVYDGITKPFELEADARRPLFVPIVAEFDAPTTITVRVEHEPVGRVVLGLFSRWTLPRTMEVGPKEMRATFVIGDDMPATGKLRLRITAESKPARGQHQLVLLPWASNRAVGPRWLAGAFEE